MNTAKTLLAVDGNSLLHRSFHAMASTGLTSSDGRPTWAVKGFISQLLAAVERAGAHAIVVGFDDHTGSVRKSAHPHYKANRPPKAPELGQQIAMTIDLLRTCGIHVVVPAGLEADDVLASASASARAAGWRTVIVTSDRDSFALIRNDTSVLRVLNGGISGSPILTPKSLESMIAVPPHLYREYAALRGDTSDNLTGVPRIGEKTAAKLLAAFGSVQAAFDDVDQGGERVAAELGKSFVAVLGSANNRAAFWRNVEIMTMYTDIDLGLNLAGPGAGLLPLDPATLTGALASLQLMSLQQSAVRTLCSEPQQPNDPGSDAASPAEHAGAGVDGGDAVRPAGPAHAPRALATAGSMRGSTAPQPARWNDQIW